MVRVDPRRFEVRKLFRCEMIRSGAVQCVEDRSDALVFKTEDRLAGVAHSFEPPAEGLKHHEVLASESKHRLVDVPHLF